MSPPLRRRRRRRSRRVADASTAITILSWRRRFWPPDPFGNLPAKSTTHEIKARVSTTKWQNRNLMTKSMKVWQECHEKMGNIVGNVSTSKNSLA